MKTEAIRKIVEIADKVYLWQDFSQSDYNFFIKYMSKCIPHWYTGNKEDIIMDLFLQIREKYNIDLSVWRKYKFLENYILLLSRDEETDIKRLCMWIYSIDYDDILMIPDETDLETSNNNAYVADIIVEVIKNLLPTFSELEMEVLNKCILGNATLVSVAKEYDTTLERVRITKEKIKNNIKLCVDIRLKNDINI